MRLTVFDQISRSHECPRKPHGFSRFSACQKFSLLSLPFWLQKTCFYLRALSVLNKPSEAPINSGNAIIIREIIWCCVLKTLTLTILSPLYFFWWKKRIGIFFQCKQIWRNPNQARSLKQKKLKNENLTVFAWISRFSEEKNKSLKVLAFHRLAGLVSLYISTINRKLYG